MIDEDAIRQRWEAVGSQLDERGRRLFAAGEVRTAGWGGLAVVSKITGLARSTINRGEDDIDAKPLPKGRVRCAGGGRRAVCENDPGLVPALDRLVAPATLGDPMRPLIWVSKSMEKLAATLTEMGHPISADTVRKELVKLGFSRQSNRKADEGSNHPDRNAQFEHINAKVITAQVQQQPVISVDTKKKELIGNFKNGGTDYRPKDDPPAKRLGVVGPTFSPKPRNRPRRLICTSNSFNCTSLRSQVVRKRTKCYCEDQRRVRSWLRSRCGHRRPSASRRAKSWAS